MTDRQSIHGPDCWSWGPKHYECAVREIERLRKMHQDAYQRGLQAGYRGLREMYDTIQAVKRQDAWDNTRLTEALMEAEEREERAEAENKWLRAEVERLRADLMESDEIREKLGHLLTRTAAALKGEPPEGVWHSWHDLPERAERLKEALEDIRSRSLVDLVMRSNHLELIALLSDIYQIADSEL